MELYWSPASPRLRQMCVSCRCVVDSWNEKHHRASNVYTTHYTVTRSVPRYPQSAASVACAWSVQAAPCCSGLFLSHSPI